jgi:alkylhydroperoxidase family enzyme
VTPVIGFLVRHRIRAAEKRLGVSMDYLRHMHEAAPAAFRAFAKFVPVAAYRDKLPAAPYHVARLVATRDADCGTCVQIVVNLARDDGVEPAVLTAALDRRVHDLPESLQDVYRFAEAVATASGEEDQYRERLRSVFGDEALVELAMAIATCRVFPTLKRALGHATSCSQVKVEV